jgi:primosomal protein N'
VEPAQSAFGAARPRRRRPEPVRGCVDVVPDKSGRLGALSYRVPAGLDVRVGDAVKIPFGKREAHGLVVGHGDPGKATRDILEVFGVRSDPSDVALARTVATYHFAEVQNVYARLSPSSGRGAEPAPPAEPVLTEHVVLPRVHREVADSRRTLLVRAPGVDPAVLAAQQAHSLSASSHGQVLVLCPSAEMVTRVLSIFESGAARLDSKAPRGAWKGFCEGTVRVGIGTRAAALYAAPSLGGIVVVDEEHPGHTEQTMPHTNARDLASARTRSLRIPLRLISACPSPQALGAVTSIYAVGLRSNWPKMLLLNRGDQDPRERLLPSRVKTLIRNAQNDGLEPVVLAQAKAALRRCVRCGTVRPCSDCDSSLCRHAETDPCPTCESAAGVKMRGWDKDRVSALFDGSVKVVSVAELTSIREAGVVVLFDLDGLMAVPDLLPGRFAASMIVAAAEAAGAGGTVVGLSDNPTEGVIADLFGPRDTIKVAKRFYAQAKSAGLPPFGRLVTIRVTRVNAPKIVGWPGRIHGPRKVGNEWEILVRIGSDDLGKLTPHVMRLTRGGKCKVRVE